MVLSSLDFGTMDIVSGSTDRGGQYLHVHAVVRT